MGGVTRRLLLSGGAAVGAAAAAGTAAAAAPPETTTSETAPSPQRPADAPSPDIRPRERACLDAGWRFHFGHATDPARDFGFGADGRTFAKSGSGVAAAALATFDDAAWAPIDLPHDWAVELPFRGPDQSITLKEDPRAAQGYKPIGRGFPETSVGWYRKTFDLPASDAGRRISSSSTASSATAW